MTVAITASQLRAARGLLGASQRSVARMAGIAHSTLADFERGARRTTDDALLSVKAVFESRGMIFERGGVVLRE